MIPRLHDDIVLASRFMLLLLLLFVLLFFALFSQFLLRMFIKSAAACSDQFVFQRVDHEFAIQKTSAKMQQDKMFFQLCFHPWPPVASIHTSRAQRAERSEASETTPYPYQAYFQIGAPLSFSLFLSTRQCTEQVERSEASEVPASPYPTSKRLGAEQTERSEASEVPLYPFHLFFSVGDRHWHNLFDRVALCTRQFCQRGTSTFAFQHIFPRDREDTPGNHQATQSLPTADSGCIFLIDPTPL